MAIGTKIDYIRCKIGRKVKLDKLKIESEIYEVNSGKVRISIRGDSNISVLLSPDPPNTLEHYEDIINLISQYYRVISFEPIGFGYSRPSFSFGFDVKSYSALISEVLDITNTENAILAIPCIFGFAAIHFAQNNIERVIGMVMIQTPDWAGGKEWVRRIDSKNILSRPIIGQLSMWLRYKKIQIRWNKVAEPDTTRREQINQIINSRLTHGYNFCLASPLQTIKGADILKIEKKLTIPAFVLWGTNDKSYPNSNDMSLGIYFEKINARKIGAGHFPEMTHPHELLNAIKLVTANN